MSHFYPAVFKREDVGFSVRFPDLDGCFTEGDALEEAYEMAISAIGLYLKDESSGNFNFLPGSNPKSIDLSEDEFVVLIEFNEREYLRKYDSRAVKKTLSIPAWLNAKAEDANAPFSQILQEGLKNYLHMAN